MAYRYIVEQEFEHCGHAGDKYDLQYALKMFPERAEEYKYRIAIESKFRIDEDIIRTEEYAASECKKLAEQLKEFE